MTAPGARDATIRGITAREVLGASGRPTVEARVELGCGVAALATVPSGTSTGRHEARDLRDGGARFRGMGCRKAAANVVEEIAPALVGMDATDQRGIDTRMIALDGTSDKGRLGANAILAVSIACARAAAEAGGLPLYRYLGGPAPCGLPAILATAIAGGAYSPSGLEFEDYIYVLDGFDRFSEALEALWELRLTLDELLKERFGPVADVGGAAAPPIGESREAFDLMLEAATLAGCEGKVRLGLDVAASELVDAETGRYRVGGRVLETGALAGHYAGLAETYPLVYLEDPFDEDDFAAHAALTARLDGVLVVGDDLFASNAARLRRGIQERAGNGILLKINQIGTVTEVCETARLAASGGFTPAASMRSHDTDDSFLADFAVAAGARLIKLSSPMRGERVAKYNRLVAIEAELEAAAHAG